MKYQNPMEYWINNQFEEMYQDIDDPWGCAAHCNSLDNQIFRLMLMEDFNKISFNTPKKVLDIGCGTGDATYQIFSILSRGGVNLIEMIGIDVSLTAIQKATQKYSSIKFQNKNIMYDEIESRFDLILLSEVIWYILDDIHGVFRKALRSLNPGGKLAIKQYFPKDQKIGKQVIDGFQGFETFLDELQTDLPFRVVSNILTSHNSQEKVLLMKLERI
jgi:SAM-dependent methyltransferase